MKKLLLIILLIFYVYTTYGQNKKDNYFILTGQVKVIINDVDTICATDEPLLFIDRELKYNMVDSVGFFNVTVTKKSKYSLKLSGWGYKIDTIIAADQINNNLVLYGSVNCDVGRSMAEKDIINDNIRLLIIGGIAPIANTSQDKVFEKKYKLTYFDYGDTPPFFGCVKKYNEVIIKYLDATYATQWRSTVRKDVEGI